MTIKNLSRISILLFITVFFSCATTNPQNISPGFSNRAWGLVGSAVFEVVVKKPLNDSLTYDKELNWNLVPFAIRTDDYFSIGTAFAVSRTDLVTAFHVLDLEKESKIFDRYFIRDSSGNVFEIDLILKACKEKDFAVFTVKNRTFDRFFEFERNFVVGSQVFSIGNALGEGIIVRNGLVLGTVPERDSGRWDLLKSSADGNPGNSGGPLVTSSGRVVGIITGLRDNILYSVPSGVMLEAPANTLSFRVKLTYVHLLLANRLTKESETTIQLPDTYTAIKRNLAAWFHDDYKNTMTELFSAAPEYLHSPNNSFFLHTAINTAFPQVAFVNRNNNEWRLSDFSVDNFTLPDDGLLMASTVSGFTFLKVNRPKTSDIAELNSNPRYLMDMILRGLNLERTLGAEKYRILSFGDPVSVSEYRDRMGRTWLTASWIIEFEDNIIIMHILPLPDGPAAVMTIQSSEDYRMYDWDIKAICDLLHVAYNGDFREWSNFLKVRKWLPEFFSDFSFQWDERGKGVSLQYSSFSISANADVFDWASTSSLFLAPSYYAADSEIKYGVRRMVLRRDIRGRDFIVLFKNVRPHERLGAKAAEAWDSVLRENHPFDGNAVISARDNNGFVGAILHQENPLPDVRFSLYMAMENPQSEEALTNRFNILKEGVVIVD